MNCATLYTMFYPLRHPVESFKMEPVSSYWIAASLGATAFSTSSAVETSSPADKVYHFGIAVVFLAIAAFQGRKTEKNIELTKQRKEQRDAELRESNFNWLNEGMDEPTNPAYFERQGEIPDVTKEECSRGRIDTSIFRAQQNTMKNPEQPEGQLPHPLVINQAGEVIANAQFNFAPVNSAN